MGFSLYLKVEAGVSSAVIVADGVSGKADGYAADKLSPCDVCMREEECYDEGHQPSLCARGGGAQRNGGVRVQ